MAEEIQIITEDILHLKVWEYIRNNPGYQYTIYTTSTGIDRMKEASQNLDSVSLIAQLRVAIQEDILEIKVNKDPIPSGAENTILLPDGNSYRF